MFHREIQVVWKVYAKLLTSKKKKKTTDKNLIQNISFKESTSLNKNHQHDFWGDRMPLSRPFFILFSLLILGPIQVKQRPSGNYDNKHNFLGLLNLWEFIIHGHSVRDRSWLSDRIIHYQAHCWVQSTKCLYPN